MEAAAMTGAVEVHEVLISIIHPLTLCVCQVRT
jgi:hypothetical protein